jgi:putative glutathione S-transferase
VAIPLLLPPPFGPPQTTPNPPTRLTLLIKKKPVYVQHFKCNLRDIRSGYPALHNWMRHLYWDHAAFRDTTNFLHIKNHYTRSHTQINPLSITPLGPVPDVLPLGEEVAAARK